MINCLTEGVEGESFPVPHVQNRHMVGLIFWDSIFPSGVEGRGFEQKWINHEARLSIIFEHNRNLICLKEKMRGEIDLNMSLIKCYDRSNPKREKDDWAAWESL